MVVYKNLEGMLTQEVLPKAQAGYYPVMYMTGKLPRTTQSGSSTFGPRFEPRTH
jgi:hypothetical protein